MEKPYVMLAFYGFHPISDPQMLIKKYKTFFHAIGGKGRTYISEEGINGQMSVHNKSLEAALAFIRAEPGYEELPVKCHAYKEHGFEKLIVKYRAQIVALDKKVDMTKRGEHMSPEQWAQTLESDEDYLLLDVRNDYEWEIGHFKGAERPPCTTFREFPNYAKALKEKYGTKKKVLMACTGGIRCEPFSALMKEEGFDEVYQLDGGMINYGNTVGSKHWEGRLFVFDDRMAVPLVEGENPEPIAQCSFCDAKCDTYYNCSNMDCNALFLACAACHAERKGTCSSPCTEAPRLREIDPNVGNLPFRKWYKYLGEKKVAAAVD